jgi:hypothetical protein
MREDEEDKELEEEVLEVWRSLATENSSGKLVRNGKQCLICKVV